MAKPIGPICNLDCKYCYYLEKEKLYPEVGAGAAAWRMSDETLEAYVRQVLQMQRGPTASFVWQGGEPTLLGVDFFRKAVSLQKVYASGRRVENALQTNGVLLDDAWCEFFKTEGFLIGLSMDGPRELHDAYRLDKGGAPTFDKVIKAIGVLKKHGVEFNTLTTVNRRNSESPLAVYRFLKQVGSGFLQFIPVVERAARTPRADGLVLITPKADSPAQVTDWSVDALAYGRFLCAIFDEWVRHDVGRVFVQSFDVALEAWCGLDPSLCVFRRTCGDALVMERNGDLYSCDHYVFPEYKLGNILDEPLKALVRRPAQVEFGDAKETSLPRYCLACDVRFACNGECPRNRFIRTPDGEEGLNYLCAGYKLFFTHVDPYMKFMAGELQAQRAPANVMAWTARRDLTDHSARPTKFHRSRKHRKRRAHK
jgi:uncharacterized protein